VRLPLARLTAGLLVLAPGASLAAEQGKLPQLDVRTYSSQLFWLAVMFVVVYVFMRWVAVPRVSQIVEDRQRRISTDLDAAERTRQAADETRQAYEATLAKAHADARRLLAETHERSIAAAADRTRESVAAFDQRVADAVSRIEAARAEALHGLRDVAQSLAADIAVKIVGHAPAPDRLARAVDDAAGREAA
jgi:F-type H+-transporting ATPase subunit b